MHVADKKGFTSPLQPYPSTKKKINKIIKSSKQNWYIVHARNYSIVLTHNFSLPVSRDIFIKMWSLLLERSSAPAAYSSLAAI